MYSGRSYRHSPCFRCRLRMSSAGTLEFKRGMEIGAVEPGADPDDDRNTDQQDRVLEIIRVLMSMRPDQRNCFCWKYQGMKLKEIGRRQGLSAGGVRQRLKRIERDYPVLGQVL